MINQSQQKSTSFKSSLSNYRICTILLFFNIVILGIIIGIIIAIWQINSTILNSYFEISANFIFTHQNQKLLASIAQSYVQQIWDFTNKTERQLKHMQSLYLHSFNYTANIFPEMCYTEIDESESYSYAYQGYCVNIYDTEFKQYDELEEPLFFQVYYNYISMLNEYLLPFDPSQQFLPDNVYLTLLEREFTAWWPQWDRISGYHPSQRKWYIQHLENYQKYPSQTCFLSDLYQFYATYPIQAFTLTCNLKNEKNELIGILASDMQFLNNQFLHPRLNIMVINYDGLLLMSTYQTLIMANSTQLGYFYDENITGFTIEDWNEINNFIKKQPYQSNCKTLPNADDILCRFNIYFEQDIIIYGQNISHPDFIFVVFFNLTDDIQQLMSQNDIVTQMKQEFYQMIMVFLLSTFFIIFSQLLILWMVFLPLRDLIKHSKAYLKQNSHKLLFGQKEYYLYNFYINAYQSNNVLIALKLAYKQVYHRLSKQSFKKSPICQDIQKFHYPFMLRKKCQIQITNISELRSELLPKQLYKQLVRPAFLRSLSQ